MTARARKLDLLNCMVVPKRGMFRYLLILMGTAYAPAQDAGTLTLEELLVRMEQARNENRARLRPYTVTRGYTLFGKEQYAAKSEVVASLTFVPPNSKQYAIERSIGAGLGQKVVRQILEKETALVKDHTATDISVANYDFRLLGEEQVGGKRCYLLDLVPKRSEPNLLRGKAWVDATTYLLHRIEGQPVKAPSWWLRDLRIELVYSSVSGMWLQTASESRANVRFLGPHTMVSRDLEYKLGESAAFNGVPAVSSAAGSGGRR